MLKSVLLLGLSTLSGVVANAAYANTLTSEQLTLVAEQLQVSYQVVDNQAQVACETDINNGKCFVSRFRYQNGGIALPKNAEIYLSHISPIQSVNNKGVSVEHINGDLHRLVFKEGLPANEFIEFNVKAPYWHASRSDVMPNQYIVLDDHAPVTIKSTTRKQEEATGLAYTGHAGNWDTESQYRRNGEDNLPLENTEYLYSQYPASWDKNAAAVQRPIPNVLTRSDTGETVSLQGLNVSKQNKALFSATADVLAKYGLVESNKGLPVHIELGALALAPEAYQLQVSNKKVNIVAADEQGAKYALVTLAQLYKASDASLPVTSIEDAPRFGFRGMHLDVARHFLGKSSIEMLIEQMFVLKLNKLHLHLSDDEGWRLQVPSLPELTDIGAFRCHDLTEKTCLLPQLGTGHGRDAVGNGYLSISDYQDLVQQADRFGIEVIPSFDMPGHARSAIKAMEARYHRLMAENKPEEAKEFLLADFDDKTEYLSIQFYKDNTINPCMNSSYHFIETLLKDIKGMHEAVGVPLKTYHLGADETAGAWKKSPVCAAKNLDAEHLLPHFVSKVVKIGNGLGLTMAGWGDGMEESLPKIHSQDVYVNMWGTLYGGAADKIEKFAAKQVPVVMSFPDVLYFDFPYRSHPLEPGYYWGARSVSTRKVFEFLPEQLRRNSRFWPDRLGNAYDDLGKPEPAKVLGMQAQLWTEVTPTPDAMEYMLFPRIHAYAERAWSLPKWHEPSLSDEQLKQGREVDWTHFAGALTQQHLPRLVEAGINVRVPPPGAVVKDKKLSMRSGMPGLKLEYSLDGKSWQAYKKPVVVKGNVWVRSRLPHTNQTSSISQL